MRPDIPRTLGSTILAVCAAAAVAACGTTHANTASPTPAASRSSALPRLSDTPQQRAAADAAAILASFVAPPGAQRLAAAPSADGGALKRASGSPVSTALVDDASWWLAPGQPQTVLAWEKTRMPRRFALGGSTIEAPGLPGTYWSDTFTLPPVSGVLNTRDLVVEAVSAGGGRTAIRVDAQVTWQPARSPSERVPSDASVVTITEQHSLLPGSKRPPAPVTITNATVTKKIAALVDGLPVSTLGLVNCPAMFGGGIELAFRARAGGPVLATANSAGGCDTVTFSVGGAQQPALANSGWLVAAVLKAAGLPWHVTG